MANGTVLGGLVILSAATACVAVANVAENDPSGVAGTGNTSSPSTGGTSAVSIPIGPDEKTFAEKAAYTPVTRDQLNAILGSDCGGGKLVEPETSPAKLELLVDVSSSMRNDPPGDVRSKWLITRDALLEAVPGVNGAGLANSTAVGLFFFPNMVDGLVLPAPGDITECINTNSVVPMASLGDNSTGSQRTRLRSALTRATLDSGTPTVDAYEYALNYCVLAPEQLALPGESYVLLITDGMPTLDRGCSNPSGKLTDVSGDPIVEAVKFAFGQGVKTFVVGSPGSEKARDWLSRAALEGGTAKPNCDPRGATAPYCHMDLTTAAAPDFSTALRDSLTTVMNQVAGCRYLIPGATEDGKQPVALDKIAPVISFADGVTILVGRDPTDNPTCVDGFRIVSDTVLELCANTCRMKLSFQSAQIRLISGCSETEIQTTLT